MRGTIGRVLLGFLGGYLFSRFRAMPGGDALDWAGVNALAAGWWRAVPLFLLGFAARGTSATRPWLAPASMALGYAFHGLLIGPTHGIPWALLALTLVAVLVGRPLIAARPEDALEEGGHPANWGERFGLALAGLGAATCLEAIARHVRLFGAGLPQDDTVFGTVFLVLVALGTAAFGWLTGLRALRRLAFPLGLVACSSACLVSLRFVDLVADGRGLRPFLERWHLGVAEFGTPQWDALFAAAAFVAPALLLGAALAGARGRDSWPSACLGAAVAFVALPRFFDQGSDGDVKSAELFSSQLVPLGVLATVVGGALAALSESRRKPRARYLTLFLIGLCALPTLLTPVKPLPILSPWEQRMLMPYVTFERATGLATVEPSASGLKVATLDRRLLSPTLDGIAADEQRIADSFALMPETKAHPRVLFVGQITPLRARSLRAQGATEVDRTAAWWKSMARLEDGLFRLEDSGVQVDPLPGTVLSPSEARERVASGAYDLVIALPIAGDTPAPARTDAPPATTVVCWYPLDAPLDGVTIPSDARLWGSDVEHAVALSANGLDVPSLAFVTNGRQAPVGDPRRVRVVDFDRDRGLETPWTRARRLMGLRVQAAHASTFAAIERRNSRPFAAGLARFYATQESTSPAMEWGLTRIELDPQALEDLQRAASEGPLDPFLRSAWSWISIVLVEKRDVPAIDRFLAPLAAAHAPWSELEIALAYADLEGLDAPAAVRRLEPVVAREVDNVRAWFALGQARELTHDAAGAAQAFGKAGELLPDRRSIQRRLAMALVWAGDPRGRELVRKLLSTDLNDPELRKFFGPEDPPPMPNSYAPASAR